MVSVRGSGNAPTKENQVTATIDAPTYDLIRELGDPVKTLTFPISVDYVKRWDLDQGLAEFVSNAIDVAPETVKVVVDYQE